MKTSSNTNLIRAMIQGLLPCLAMLFLLFPGTLSAQVPCNTLTMLDFSNDGQGNALNRGTIVTNQFQAAYGITVRAFNQNSNHPDIAMIFDSQAPTGDDFDLGTPNQAYGGPGIGSGGVGTNTTALGKLLIISEDGDQNDPDDEREGGQLRLDFAVPTYVASMKLVDIDVNGSRVRVVHNGGQVSTYNFQNLGDNSVQQVNINQSNVTRLRIELCGSAGVTDIAFCNSITPLQLNIAGSDSLCYGATTALNAQVTGGLGPYTYSWQHGPNSPSVTVGGGSYTLTVTDALGMTATTNLTVVQPQQPLTINPSVSAHEGGMNITCAGANDGWIACGVVGGFGGYQYQWSTGATTANVNNLGPGTYGLTVTDLNGCTASTSMTLVAPPAMQIGSSSNAPSCAGSSNGAASVQVGGGTPAYYYNWSTGATTPAIANLGAGTYGVTVTDANGCTVSTNATVTAPAPVQIATTPTQVSCNGANDGSIAAQVSGGSGNYSYAWSHGGNTSTATNLSPGAYTVTVTDANGCSNTTTVTITEPAALQVSATTSNISCHGSGDGSIVCQVTGGTGNYTYTWSHGATGAATSNLSPGNYAVTITDANGCTSTASYQVAEPTPVLIQMDAISPTCTQAGSVTPNISGGTPPYSHLWSTGATSPQLSGAAPGSYTLQVTDANGCISTETVALANPGIIDIALETLKADCEGTGAGQITISTSGAFGNLQFLWSNGATSQNLDGLGAGTYTVTVTDDQGSCPAEMSFEIPAPLDVNPLVNRASCPGTKDGSIDLSIAGGTQPYSVLWNNGATSTALQGLGAGQYSVQVADALGCQLNFAMDLEATPAPLALAGEDQSMRCARTTTLSAEAPETGAIGTWSGADAIYIAHPDQPVTEVKVAENTVTEMVWTVDRDGCKASDTVTITTAACPLVTEGCAGPQLPTGITPNDDGANDAFVIRCLPDAARLLVFNRWGNAVYESANYQNDWKGTNDAGEHLAEGTYFVLLKYKDDLQQDWHLKGYVDIRRNND